MIHYTFKTISLAGAIALSMSVTAFAHSWRTLEDCEGELNDAWSDLPAEYQDELRPDERRWIKYKDSLHGDAKMQAVIERAGMFWGILHRLKYGE
jgi:hypothetical protein